MKKCFIFVTFLMGICLALQAQDHRLWYSKPASHWLEALPVGNSKLGAMVYGGTEVETLQLNEETFWSGGPHENNSSESLEHLPEVQRLIFEGREREAATLIDNHFVKGPHGMRYLPVGNIQLDFGHQQVEDYERELNLGNALASTSYIYKGVRYTRTVFASQTDNVIIVRVEADKKGALSFTVGFDGQLKAEKQVSNGQLIARVKNVDRKVYKVC